MAALCFGTSSYLEIPVLHGGGKRRERAEMVQEDCVCTCRARRLHVRLDACVEEMDSEDLSASLQRQSPA